MRWLIFFLLVLNALTFSWFVFQGDQEVQLAEKEQRKKFDFAAVPSLKLLSELPAAEVKSRDVRGVSSTANTIGLEQSHKVSESGVGEVVESGLAIPEPEIVTKPEAMCALIGSFPEMVSAKQAKARLAKKGMKSEVVLVSKELPAINWVYIAPQNNRKEALAILKRLQEDNIDSFLIADGEYKNGISLGFFSKLESAGAVMKERRRQGYEVSITRKTREQKTFWVVLDEKSSLRVDEDLIESIRGEVAGLKKQEKSCQDVALLQIIE